MSDFPIIDSIKKRKSIRSYSDEKLSEEIINELCSFINSNLFGPLGTSLKFQIIDTETKTTKLGTYGFISGASKFLVFYIKRANINWLDVGYIVEKIILYSTSIGIGTCWIGGTFNRSNLSKNILESEDYLIPIITPIGIPNNSKTLRDKLLRKAAGAEKRIPLEQILINENKSVYLENEFHRNILEMVQIAPSASNKQPWRIFIKNDTYHFYLKRSKGYRKLIPSVDLQQIDLGISICHFFLTIEALNMKTNYFFDTDNKKDGLEYQISWKIDNN